MAWPSSFQPERHDDTIPPGWSKNIFEYACIKSGEQEKTDDGDPLQRSTSKVGVVKARLESWPIWEIRSMKLINIEINKIKKMDITIMMEIIIHIRWEFKSFNRCGFNQCQLNKEDD
jgi:hypothetical protein